MIRQVAVAIANEMIKRGCAFVVSDKIDRPIEIYLAKAAISALRDCSPEMADAGNEYDCQPLASEVWAVMIDEALKD